MSRSKVWENEHSERPWYYTLLVGLMVGLIIGEFNCLFYVYAAQSCICLCIILKVDVLAGCMGVTDELNITLVCCFGIVADYYNIIASVLYIHR